MDEFWFAFASLIVVIGPWKAAIVFAERTTALTVRTRRRVAMATVAIALVIATVTVLFGADLIEFFHIDDGAFLVAAGLLVLVFAIRMVITEEQPADPDGAREVSETRGAIWRLASYPLAVPLLITPPAIAVLVALSVEANVSGTSIVALMAAIVAVMAFDLVVFLVEARWEHLVPGVVLSVAGRILGVLLAAFGASIIFEGLKVAGVIAGDPSGS